MRMPPADDAIVVPAPEATPLAQVEPRTDTQIVVGARRSPSSPRRRARRAGWRVTVELRSRAAERARWSRSSSRSPGSAPAYLPLGHRYIGAPAPPPAADLAPLYAVLADPAIAKSSTTRSR